MRPIPPLDKYCAINLPWPQGWTSIQSPCLHLSCHLWTQRKGLSVSYWGTGIIYWNVACARDSTYLRVPRNSNVNWHRSICFIVRGARARVSGHPMQCNVIVRLTRMYPSERRHLHRCHISVASPLTPLDKFITYIYWTISSLTRI